MPEGGAGIESGRINCTRVVLESLESDLTDVEIEHFDGIGPVKRCGAEGEQTELVFLLETAFIVRIWAFDWNSEGYPLDNVGWNEPVQDEILTAILSDLAQRG